MFGRKDGKHIHCSPKIQLGHLLTRILRWEGVVGGLKSGQFPDGTQKYGRQIDIDAQGYMAVSDILTSRIVQHARPCATHENIKNIVATCPKKRFRFTIRDKQWFMKANYGHGGKFSGILHDAEAMTEITPANENEQLRIYHCTDYAGWSKIESSNEVRTMDRKHIHFTNKLQLPRSGNTHTRSDVVLRTSTQKLRQQRIQTWAPQANVTVTGGDKRHRLPLRKEFFEVAYDYHTGKTLWPPEHRNRIEPEAADDYHVLRWECHTHKATAEFQSEEMEAEFAKMDQMNPKELEAYGKFHTCTDSYASLI